MNNSDKILQKKTEVENQLNQKDFLNNYILETLNSFSYRFFDPATKAEMISNEVYRVVSIEVGIKAAIKIQNPTLRAGIGELVKRVSRNQGPTIARMLQVKFLSRTGNKSGEAQISAQISFGHPAHDFQTPKTFVDKNCTISFDDELQLRNILAKHLEDVCSLFEY